MRKIFCIFLVIVLLVAPGLVSGATYLYANNIEYDSAISQEFGMDEYPTEFYEEVDDILSFISPSMSDVEKALAVHEYFMLNYSYGTRYESFERNYIFEQAEAYTAYGIMVNKIGVCEAYTQAYQYIMEKLDIPCIKVTSTAMDHAWNMVCIDDKWYHVDVTWDDNIGGHANFLRSDEGIKETGHYAWNNAPRAESTQYDNAFWISTLSNICYIDGFWYYLDLGDIDLRHQDGFTIIDRSNCSRDGNIKRYDFKTDIHKTVFAVKPKTYTYKKGERSYETEWEGSQTSIAAWGGKIYYNTNNEIYSVNPDGTGHTLVCKVTPVDLFFPDINGRAYIEEIAIRNGIVYYVHSDYGDLHTACNLQDAIPEYIITADAGAGGFISPSGNIGVLHNRSRTFKISATNDCELTDVLVDGVSVGSVSSYTFSNVTSDHKIEAVFDVAGGEWQITWLDKGLKVAGDFSEGLALVENEGGYGYINTLGELVIPTCTDYIPVYDFNGGRAVVFKDEKYGCIDTSGTLVVPCIYEWISYAGDKMLEVVMDNKYGVINSSGELIVPCIYDQLVFLKDGMILAEKDRKFGFINTTGDIVVPCIYDSVWEFKNGIACLLKDGKEIYIDQAGNEVPAPKNGLDYFYTNEEKLTTVYKDGKWGFVNALGKEVVPYIYDDIRDYYDEFLHVSQNGKWGFLNNKGDVVAPCIYDSVYNFSEGFALVCKNEKYGFINTLGEEVIPCSYRYAYDFSEGLAHVIKDKEDGSIKDGYVNTFGDLVIPLIYDDARNFKEGLAAIEANYRWGIMKKAPERGKAAFEPVDSKTEVLFTEVCYEPQSVSPPVENMITPRFERWAEAKNSYLIKNNNGTISVLEVSDRINIHLYDNSYNNIGSRCIDFELPIFGAFYSGEKYNYIAFGQTNSEEADSKEVIRIVKYSKDFARIDSVSILGGESYTISPFAFSCGRIAEYGNKLVLHASRLRYTTEDGLNHQSQLTIIVDTDTMSVLNDLGKFQPNHVSHSFNQFVIFDGEKHVLVDHGDAYPRSVVLSKQYNENRYTEVNLFDIPGETGANFTGVSVGGFEMSSTNYIVAINSIDHSDESEYTNYGKVGLNIDIRDVILCVVPKASLSDNSVKQFKLTNYIGTDRYASVPKLVKIGDNKFMVIWQEVFSDREKHGNWLFGDIKYVFLDGSGIIKGEIQTLTDCVLSVCDPITLGEQVIWYTNISGDRRFYAIPIE